MIFNIERVNSEFLQVTGAGILHNALAVISEPLKKRSVFIWKEFLKMANDVIIATVPATEVESAPVEVAEVSAVEEAAESPAPVDVAEVESEVAPAEVEGDAEAAFAVDGDLLKSAMATLLTCRQTVQGKAEKHAPAIGFIANDDGLTLQTCGCGFCAEMLIPGNKGFTGAAPCNFSISAFAAEFIAKSFDAEMRYSFTLDDGKVNIVDNTDRACVFNVTYGLTPLRLHETTAGVPATITIGCSALAALLKRVLYTANDETKGTPRSFTTVVNFNAAQGTLMLAATNGVALATASTQLATISAAAVNMNIPKITLQVVSRLLTGKGSVEICQSDDRVIFKVDDWRISSRTLPAAEFPKIDAILGEEAKAAVMFKRAEILDAVKFVASATNAHKSISLDFASGRVTITAKSNSNIGSDGGFDDIDSDAKFDDVTAQISRAATIDGDVQNVRVAVNAQYLLDMLRHDTRENIALEVKAQMLSIKGESYQMILSTQKRAIISKQLPAATPDVKPEFTVANMPESVKVA